MYKKVTITLLLSLFALPAGAQVDIVVEGARVKIGDRLEARIDARADTRAEARDAVQVSIQDSRGEIHVESRAEAREATQVRVQEKRAEIRVNADMSRAEARAEFVAERKTEREAAMAARAEKLALAKDLRETNRAELKLRLEKIKDERKQEVVLRVEEQITNLNSRLTTNFGNILDKIDAALVRVSTRADARAEAGTDVSTALLAIASAEETITSARAAVLAQAGATYVLTVNTEATLRADVSAAREELRNDLSATKEVLRAAHTAVRDATIALTQIPRSAAEVEAEASTEVTQ
ncbi:MAG: hypothetical protein COV10_01060 [Candidatus Vogelbacteria bacterium CG10_big_fil_rev_8_21_14_0_10_51_16]|uniref:DUF5667 domain-containing protein n=1 Tax=Candidatus Vogelbacteria bacterium CG10_big_fil_rev_8_21_14_0_10_51_16 TaxID=1975045 RepID=A0A2H0RF15_9BACT|nr:MAG: hypothetical protein COV10_01060 [Candidatus Vogelbacteria bacterium CG10_big_fil_rev_8_21_14_0_10_51_16]